MTAQDILKQYFGYSAFRPGQDALVSHILEGRDTLGIMPTGAGKSICYQVPALAFSGLTLVISPLISLMKDQVGALHESGVAAAYLNSALSAPEMREVIANAREGRYKLLYIAPERLTTPDFLDFACQTEISMVTIDEAHCISQWGQDFRPSYLKILDFLRLLPHRPLVSAFTATATAAVRDDVIRALGLREPFVLTTGFDRPNLYFSVEQPSSKPQALLRLLAVRTGKSGIVYCATRKTVEDVCDMLRIKGLGATRYHAGLPAEERQRNQDDFLYDRAPVMVATNAFGMGIDKSNVSFVVHYNMPKNMESYYQEAGRAGRDGEAADCILLYSPQDVRTGQFLIERSHEAADEQVDPETRRALIDRDLERLRQMTFYSTTTECLRRFILQYFGESAAVSCGHCGNCDTTFEEIDATVDAQKILSCIYRLDERRLHFGKAIVSSVLCGGKTEKIEQFGLDTLSTYGIMQDATAARVRQLIDVLLERGYLLSDPERFNALFLTASGNALMRGRDTFVIKLPREKKAAPAKGGKGGAAIAGDEALFDRLRTVRARLAEQAHVPPYVIFSNATLADMAARQPITEFEFLEVRGVGEAKANRYGEIFLEEIKSYLRS
ncbi:DNA helicase RecQ [Butyricicoccus sp. Marseille-Q5471]|uniref:DNA helicase RecQ n=1 Tax=Butyricicoccus sp. Marseille-Q5471 TaxID=3039493 RepID=UPI0024BD27B7|nr:DNA helicase RecQ [Butyricicoccus sp. Marseille-Q5471]